MNVAQLPGGLVAAAITLIVIALAGNYLAAALHHPGLPLTGWLHRIPAPRLPRLPRVRRRERARHADKVNPVRMAPRGKHHAGQPMRLKPALDGLLHDPLTGPFNVPADYGVIDPELDAMLVADRMWRGPC